MGRDLKEHLLPPPAMGKDPFHYPRVLQGMSSLALDASRDAGTARAALGSLGAVRDEDPDKSLPSSCPSEHPGAAPTLNSFQGDISMSLLSPLPEYLL